MLIREERIVVFCKESKGQTRILIEEVLQIRLEHIDMSVLLADGKLLLELSKVIRSRMGWATASDDKMSEWKPYANFASFLDTCIKLGLDDIDIFDSPDVVKKRNTRKICLCIQLALSKMAELEGLNVPDSGSVTRTSGMATDNGEVQEFSQGSSSLSAEQYDSEKVSRDRNGMNTPISFSKGTNSDFKSPPTDLNPSTSLVIVKDIVIFTEDSHDTQKISEESHLQYDINMNKGESEQKDTEKEMPEISEPLNSNSNPIPQRRLLNSIIKGVAVVGFAFFLLHLRKTSSRGNLPKPKEKPKEVLEANTPKSKPLSQEYGSSQCVYPSDRLSFGF